jgi:hypothetical protein
VRGASWAVLEDEDAEGGLAHLVVKLAHGTNVSSTVGMAVGGEGLEPPTSSV